MYKSSAVLCLLPSCAFCCFEFLPFWAYAVLCLLLFCASAVSCSAVLYVQRWSCQHILKWNIHRLIVNLGPLLLLLRQSHLELCHNSPLTVIWQQPTWGEIQRQILQHDSTVIEPCFKKSQRQLNLWLRWVYCQVSNLAISSSPVKNNHVQFLLGVPLSCET